MADTTSNLTPALQQSIVEARKAFTATANSVRPRLHRFCARMCGSAFHGEDVLQETLADAFYNLASLKDPARLEPWLFRIAYNKCIDFLRRQQANDRDIAFADEHEAIVADGILPSAAATDLMAIDDALIKLVHVLPPKERAAVLLKDVLDYSLEETARVVDSTVGGVKAALHRGRTKLRELTMEPTVTALDHSQRRLFAAYADCFNKRDWEALSRLVRADATLEIVGEARGDMSGLGATYSTNYQRLPWEWRLSAAVVDSIPVVVHWRRVGDMWQQHSAIQLWWQDEQVVRIRDYIHVEYILREAAVLPALPTNHIP